MHSKLPILFAIVTALLTALGVSPGTLSPRLGLTGATTGLSGATTGGIGGTYTSSGNTIYIVNMSERRSASTYGYFSSTWQTLTGRHCAGMQFHSQSWTYTGSPPASNVASITHGESIYIVQGTEFGSVPSGTSLGNPPSGAGSLSYSIKGGDVAAGNDIVVQTSDTGAIESGRHLKWFKLTVDTTTYTDSTPTSTTYHWYGDGGIDATTPYDELLIKLDCNDASLTTRKTYGQPNKGGELPADPNAPLRHPNYGNWDFKGGLFVGNMPAGDKDASGTSRADFFVQGGSSHTSTYEFAALSIYDQGKPSDTYTAGNFELGLYIPSSSDSLFSSLTDSNVNWDYQWSITPGDVSTSTDYTQHPFSHATLTNGNSDDYVVLPIVGPGGVTKPTAALTGDCLAIVDEATVVGADTKCWHYFASSEYQTGSTFPRSDCAPRIWLVEPYVP
jgi:hypothetical protein